MNIMDYLPEHKVVEINESTGLRVGHMLAQQELTATAFFDGAVPADEKDLYIELSYGLTCR